MRTTLFLFLMLWCGALSAHAQAPLELGSPQSAFAGSPIHLSRHATAMLRSHYQGDKVPIVPAPFRARLDAAVIGRDWTAVRTIKKQLVDKYGIEAALSWEQTRFIATGSIGMAEIHAQDLAATGSTGLFETAVMLWFYSAAVTMTDGHKCVDETAKDKHLDQLRGSAFEPVLQIVRSIADDRLAAMRDLAIRLETVLAEDRSDDTMCRVVTEAPAIKPDALWRPEAAETRSMLPKHLQALASVMRPRPVSAAGPERQATESSTRH